DRRECSRLSQWLHRGIHPGARPHRRCRSTRPDLGGRRPARLGAETPPADCLRATDAAAQLAGNLLSAVVIVGGELRYDRYLGGPRNWADCGICGRIRRSCGCFPATSSSRNEAALPSITMEPTFLPGLMFASGGPLGWWQRQRTASHLPAPYGG